MFKFIKKLFKKKEPEEDPNIIIEEEEKAKQHQCHQWAGTVTTITTQW